MSCSSELRLVLPIDCLSSFLEGADYFIRGALEKRVEYQVQVFVGEFEAQVKFNFAAGLRFKGKKPKSLKDFKGTLQEIDVDALTRKKFVSSGERDAGRSQSYPELHHYSVVLSAGYPRFFTPGKELLVPIHIGHQLKHFLLGIWNNLALLHFMHSNSFSALQVGGNSPFVMLFLDQT